MENVNIALVIRNFMENDGKEIDLSDKHHNFFYEYFITILYATLEVLQRILFFI